jgi:hypothetical protein
MPAKHIKAQEEKLVSKVSALLLLKSISMSIIS